VVLDGGRSLVGFRRKCGGGATTKRIAWVIALLMLCGCERFKPVPSSTDQRSDARTAQNCWAGGPSERYWDNGFAWKTVTRPHIPTCASLRAGDTPVFAEQIFVDTQQSR
jgi:hypothetical protein